MEKSGADQAIAHVKQNPDGSWAEPHDLLQHLRRVAWKSRKSARQFGNGDWAALAGLWHDLGKFKPAFQKYIREQGNYELLELDSPGSTDKQHAIVGALQAFDQFTKSWGEDGSSFARIFSYLIAGHHTGLPDWNHESGIGGALEPKLREKEHLADALLGNPPQRLLEAPLPETTFGSNLSEDLTGEVLLENLHLWIRVLFSCLVDADFLDTEKYMDQRRTVIRATKSPRIADLKNLLDTYLENLAGQNPKGSVNPVHELRQEILAQCRSHSVWKPGVFSLTVPTGGGKTLSGMAFALEHARHHQKRRIIVAIPYTSIIEQTAKVYRKVFGDDAVLEHHSNLDPSRDTDRSKLASENWDAPIVVTTNVQLFESLFASRTSACRKLHNIVNSVIILDEAQMLPPGYLEPVVSSLKGLCSLFGCSVVLSTATQPALDGRFQSGKAVFHGFEPGTVRELMADPKELARRLKRVELQTFTGASDRAQWDEIAEALCHEPQVLCIVNTRKDCRQLYDLMPPGTIHLSALMCPEHRTVVINDIKAKLAQNQPIRVVSTQLVEAGVDLDFPVVFRALAGFDSIAQAAGRCNREGKLNLLGKLGRTVIFQPPNDAPAGLLRKGQDAGAEILRVYPGLAADLDPAVFEHYFKLFFGKVNSFDEKGIVKLLTGPDAEEAKIQFRTAASRFSLVENAGQVSVIVWYDQAVKSLVNELERTGPYRNLMRRLQRYTVSVPERVVRGLVDQGFLRPIIGMEGLYTQTDLVTQGKERNLYDEVFGLRLEGLQLDAYDTVA